MEQAWGISSAAAKWPGAQSARTVLYSAALSVTFGAGWTFRHHLVFPNNDL